ncbi:T7SS effector LXG polymorphic toxin [Rossellomorea vietnamensis]|uniref:T7SS effector LXG polymorphic toxin n=1 Tax=Rossellomorea vietnamensis TaxID=218284 RepID=UPI001E35315A|nr:T7SS effector LXG polymorphic toxin [Rossellomorea vietnamensis]MCC5803743.1 HNH endonuclease [Rossellomorea vietnamensis]
MKILDVDGFQHGIKEIEETLSSQKDQVEQIERAVQDVVNLDDAFKGEGGNAIRDFYRSQHLPMLEQYQLFLSDYQSVIRQMKEALDHVEPSPDGFMRQSFLDNEVEEGLHRARRTTVELTGEANATIRSVSDIVSVPRIQDCSFLQQVTHAQEEKERSLRKLHEFDHTQTASLAPLEEQVHTMTQQIARLQTVFQKGKLGIIEKKAHQEDSSFLSKLSEFTSVMAKNKVSEFLGTVEGALFAIVDIVSDLADTVIALFTDPIGFFKGIIHTVLHPIDTAKYIWKDLKQSFEEEVVNGDVRSRARYFSYAGTYIAASIFGAKGVDKVGKMGKAGKMSSKTDVPYNVMTTAKIKSFIHNGVKSTFGKVEDTAHQLLSSRTGKRALGLNAFSGHLQELFRETKNVLNPEKVKSVMEKTYQKVVAGPVSRVAQSEAFSRMGKVLLNEDGHVVLYGKEKSRRVGNEGIVKSKEVNETNLRNIDDFISGNKKFDEVIEDYAKVYKKHVDLNKPWSWDDIIPGGDSLSSAQKRKIKEMAIEKGHIPEIKVTKVAGMRYGFADFARAGVVEETVQLPEVFWKLSDKEQFKWLDEQIGGTRKGMTWHHTEVPSRMELVPFGIHNITPHNGGRTKGMWADAPR